MPEKLELENKEGHEIWNFILESLGDYEETTM